MSRRAVSWLVWAMWVLTGALLALSLLLILFIPSMRVTNVSEAVAAVIDLALILSFSTIGLLIATRRPQNFIGWIKIVAGRAQAVTFLAGSYVDLDFYIPSLGQP